MLALSATPCPQMEGEPLVARVSVVGVMELMVSVHTFEVPGAATLRSPL